jgi:type II secretory pathway predicted ATPase ExeA
MIDEAQNPSFAVLAHIRRRPKPETDKQKLRQVVLMGQPELNEIPPPRVAAPAQLGSLRAPPGLADRPRARWGAPAHAR